MSLVVAQCSRSGIRAVSDTRLFDPISRLPCSHFDGTLKLFVLSGRLAFGFAGDPRHALRALEECQRSSAEELRVEEIMPILIDASAADGGATDFLVLSTEPSSRLYRLQNGGIEESDTQLWIGDIDGFDMYQRALHEELSGLPEQYRNDPEVRQNQMSPALQTVIDSPAVSSVGDFLVPVNSDNGLHYSVDAKVRVYPTEIRQTDGWYRTRPGTAEEGSYSVTMLTCSDRRITAVGFYLFEARFGILFNPQKFSGTDIIRQVDIDGYVREVARKHGIQFTNYLRPMG